MNELQIKLNEAVKNIMENHHKIIDDWCKAYMAERYSEGKIIKPGSFTLNEQDFDFKDNKYGKRYWFTEGIPDYSTEDLCFLRMKLSSILCKWNLDVMHNDEDNELIIKDLIRCFKD